MRGVAVGEETRETIMSLTRPARNSTFASIVGILASCGGLPVDEAEQASPMAAGAVLELGVARAGLTASEGTTPSFGAMGYKPTGDYLLDPARSIAMLKSLADYRVKARDDAHGGYFTVTDSDGTVGADRRKGFVTQTRDAWAFSRAFMVTGDDAYLDHATHALDYLYSHGWDGAYGGWYFSVDELGNLTPYSETEDWNTVKWSFMQHYALLGIGAFCDATRDQVSCDWLRRGREFLDTKMWDADPSQLGYYYQADLDMSNLQGKGFFPTVDALTTNGIQAELLWPKEPYHQRMVDLANIVVQRLVANMDQSTVQFGYPEFYDTSWNVDSSITTGDVGHLLKSAWVLARVYMRHPDPRYREAARQLIQQVLDRGGWDETDGVPYTRYDWSTGEITKLAECWQIEQAITSGLSNWHIAEAPADRDRYLEMADRALQFFVKYVVDHANGGTYKMNSITGEPTPDTPKSNFYNVEYHSTETFYFTYLYGNLLLHHRPVALHYRVAASATPQILQLNPVAVDDASLHILSVTLDGRPLRTFSGSTREVRLAAGQGGKLRVVFGPGCSPHRLHPREPIARTWRTTRLRQRRRDGSRWAARQMPWRPRFTRLLCQDRLHPGRIRE